MIVKRCVTLIEMIIVMVLIGLILGIVAYNYSGSLDEGKAFKTKTGIEKLQTILSMYVAENPESAGDLTANWTNIVEHSPLVQNPKNLEKDGWGNTYHVSTDSDGKIIITSERYNKYVQEHPSSMFKK